MNESEATGAVVGPAPSPTSLRSAGTNGGSGSWLAVIPARFGRLRACAVGLLAGSLAAEAALGQAAAQVEVREAREILRLGHEQDAPDWQAFTRVPRLLLDARGRLHVMPSGDPRVRLLDEKGGFVRYIGRSGEGPGEFTRMFAMGFLGDTLWIENWTAPRVSFFDSAGAHLKTAVDPRGPKIGSESRITVPLAGGSELLIPSPTGPEDAGRAKAPLTVGPRSGSPRDTVAFVIRSDRMEIEGLGSFGHRLVRLPPLYRALPSGSGVVVADWDVDRPDRVVLRSFDAKGELVSESEVRFRPRAISAEARERFIDEGVAMVKRTAEALPATAAEAVPRDIRAAVVKGSILPSHYAPISALFVTHEGRVWLKETSVADEYEGEWIVVGADGAVEFRVRPPSGIRFQTARGNRVWGTGTTELDVPYIALYELAPAGGSSR